MRMCQQVHLRVYLVDERISDLLMHIKTDHIGMFIVLLFKIFYVDSYHFILLGESKGVCMLTKGVFLVSIILTLSMALPAGTLAKTVTRDSNNDGQIDQKAHFQNGELILLEVDTNADQVFDRKQHYEQGELSQVERDTDQDGFWETVDVYTQGRRKKQTIFSAIGKIKQVSTFDSQGRPLEIRKDSSGDHILDTTYAYRNGNLHKAITDQDDNGVWETCRLFEQGTLAKFLKDENQDGQPEQVVWYNKDGNPQQSEHDLDEDGIRETFRQYEQGNVSRQETQDPQTGKIRQITLFSSGEPQKLTQDTTGDGSFDSVTFFTQGRPAKQEKDTNANGRHDTLILFNSKGEVREMREDTNHNGHFDRMVIMAGGDVHKEKLDENHDQFFEIRITYAQGTRKQMTKDQNTDGKPDTIIDYDAKGERSKLTTDANNDQRMDTWQYYAQGRLKRMEKDENGDGQVDLKVKYSGGDKDKLLRDQDGDGHFEIVQLYRVKDWDMVIEQDRDGNGRPEARLMYAKGLLRQKEIYDRQGKIQFIEYFDELGELCRSREREDQGLSLTWIYNAQGQAVQARRDKDLDGTDEVIFFYQNGTLRRVEEDTNGDGKMDVWEYYDQSEALVRKAQDLDFDGEPDLEK